MTNFIQYCYSSNGGNDFVLTVEGQEIGRVYSKEYAELIESVTCVIPMLEYQLSKLTKECDELTLLNNQLKNGK